MPKDRLESAAIPWPFAVLIMVGCRLRTSVMFMAPLDNPASRNHQHADR